MNKKVLIYYFADVARNKQKSFTLNNNTYHIKNRFLSLTFSKLILLNKYVLIIINLSIHNIDSIKLSITNSYQYVNDQHVLNLNGSYNKFCYLENYKA